MSAKGEVFFPPFRLDLANERLFREERQLTLRHQNFVVLRYLMEHAGHVVSKEEIGKAIWGPYPAEEALKQCIFQLRGLLGDDVKSPRFIETARGGYKFIAPLKNPLPPLPRVPALVGRDAELALLRSALEKAQRGERQIVFITGEPGIGKTTLVDAFTARIAEDPAIWTSRGQCIEHYGEGEAYLPILEALGRFSSRAGAEQFSAFLGRYAPTWLAQLPSLVDEDKQEALQRRVQGATRQRMLREIVEMIEIFTTSEVNGAPPSLVFVLEDLQWSDYSTLDLLASIARRREPARVLILGTYRPAEGLSEGHPLRAVTQELRGHGQCKELALEPLSAEAVEMYVEKRFPASALPVRLPEALYRRTEGNPLFLATVVDDLIDRKVLVQADGGWVLQNGIEALEAGVPENIRQLVARQIERLSEKEQRVLEAASVAGLEFSAAAVAAAVDVDVADVEACCNALARRDHFLQPAGRSEWPDGTAATGYGFRHAVYQYLWRERLALNQRQRLHLRIGERQEAAYRDRAEEIAAELAVHFEEGHDFRRALRYRQQAAMNALRRSAHQEAASHLTKGLELLTALPDTPVRTKQELGLQFALGPTLMVAKGYAAPEVARAYIRTRELCQQVGDTVRLFPVLLGMCGFYMVRAELQKARELGEQCLTVAQQTRDPDQLLGAHFVLGLTLFYCGELATPQAHFKQVLALYDPQRHRAFALRSGQDSGVTSLSHSAIALWLLGYPQQALQRGEEALTLAQDLDHPFSSAGTLVWVTCWLHFLRREVPIVQEGAESAIALSREMGFPVWEAIGVIFRGWVLAEQGQGQEGIRQIRRGLAALQATGAGLNYPNYLALLAETYAKVGQVEEGLSLLAETLAIVNRSGERHSEAELHRLKGELTLKRHRNQDSEFTTLQEAEECFRKAIEIAQVQQARSLELRATMSLYRLRCAQGRSEESRPVLAALYDSFTEGFETPDLQEAKALLAGPPKQGKRAYQPKQRR